MKVKPLGERILVREAKADEKIDGFMIAPANREKQTQGVIVEAGKLADELKKGDIVIYHKSKGTAIKIDKESYLIMRQSDIFGILS